MKNKDFSEQIKLCLSCRLGHDIISDYKEIYPLIKNVELLDGELERCIKQNEKVEIIDEIAQGLNIDGTIVEKFRKLSELSTNNVDTEDYCFFHLSKIIYALKMFYGENDVFIFDRLRHETVILRLMNEYNQECYEKANRKYNFEQNKNAIKKIGNSKTNDESSNIKDETKDNLMNIFEMYCYPDDKKYIIDNGTNCFTYKFSKWRESDDMEFIKKRDEFFKRVDNLEEKKKEFLMNYLKQAPKKFCYNLCKVMEEQGMSVNDICEIIGTNTLAVSSMQYYMEKETVKQNDSKIELIARTLLVSKDVLYKGFGKMYGNWKPFLENETMKCIAKQLEDNTITKINETKAYIRGEIKDLIYQDKPKYDEILKSVPELFLEKEYSVYEGRIEMYDVLLHHEEAFVLLEILEDDKLHINK